MIIVGIVFLALSVWDRGGHSVHSGLINTPTNQPMNPISQPIRHSQSQKICGPLSNLTGTQIAVQHRFDSDQIPSYGLFSCLPFLAEIAQQESNFTNSDEPSVAIMVVVPTSMRDDGPNQVCRGGEEVEQNLVLKIENTDDAPLIVRLLPQHAAGAHIWSGRHPLLGYDVAYLPLTCLSRTATVLYTQFPPKIKLMTPGGAPLPIEPQPLRRRAFFVFICFAQYSNSR